MANSREAQLKRDIIEAITAYGCEVGIAGGCELTGEEVSELELTLTEHEQKHLRQEEAGLTNGLPRSAMSAQASSTIPRSHILPMASPTASNATKR